MKRPCNHPGCPALLNKGAYCDAHKDKQPKRHQLYDRHIRSSDPALAQAASIRNSMRWRVVRKQFLADHPLCQDPHGDHDRQGLTRSAKQVHHIKGLATHPELAFTRSNLMAVCTACHARLERKVRATPQDDAPTQHKPTSQEWSPFG